MLLSDAGEHLDEYEELKVATDEAGYTQISEATGAPVEVASRWKESGADMFSEFMAEVLCTQL